MFALIIIVAILALFAALAQVLAIGSTRNTAAFLATQGPLGRNLRAENECMLAQWHRHAQSAQYARYKGVRNLHKRFVTGR